ncbi:MAG: response regulator [Bacillota bacterium]
MNVVIIDQQIQFLDEFSGLLSNYSEIDNLHAFIFADKALVHVRATAPNCVFLEPELAGQHGLSVAAAIRACSEGIALVFVSANRQSAIKAWDLSATDYLLKPVDQERLSAVVSKCARVCRETRNTALSTNGHLEVKREAILAGASAINWHGRQSRLFFEFLLDQPGQVANKYVVCEGLFADYQPKKALAKLHYAALHARRSINEANCGFRLRYNVDSYQLITQFTPGLKESCQG